MYNHVKCKHRNKLYPFIEKPESNWYYEIFLFPKNSQIPIRCDGKKCTPTSMEVISVRKNQLSFWVINYKKIVLVNKIKIRTFSINVNKFKFMHNLSFNAVMYIGAQCTCVHDRWIGFGFASVRLSLSLCLYLFHSHPFYLRTVLCLFAAVFIQFLCHQPKTTSNTLNFQLLCKQIGPSLCIVMYLCFRVLIEF